MIFFTARILYTAQTGASINQYSIRLFSFKPLTEKSLTLISLFNLFEFVLSDYDYIDRKPKIGDVPVHNYCFLLLKFI